MGREKRTRQLNREYQERIRREQAGARPPQRRTAGQGSRGSAQSRNARPESSQRPKRNPNRSLKERERESRVRNPDSQRRNAPVRGEQRPPAGRRQNPQRRPEERQTARQSQEYRRPPQRSASSHPQSRKQKVYFEYTLVFVVIFLMLFGLLMLYAASLYTTSFFVKQCIIAVLALAGLFVFSFIDYHIYAKKTVLAGLVIGAVILVLLVKSPIGITRNGASRWIKVKGISIQPAEVFKIAVILVNAYLITLYSRKMKEWPIKGMFGVLALVEFFFIYVVTQNLSSAIIVIMITLLMVFVAYPGYKLFLGLGAGGVAFVAGYIYYVLNAGAGKNFRSGRIIAWLAPERLADQSKVFQSNQALYAIGSGGLWGKGLGAGTQKMILPEAMNDMIFAIICEELGVLGAMLVLVMFAILLYRLMFIAKNSKDLLGGMIATGIFIHFMLQVILNIGVVTGLLPSTGVTLPFISAGGTALVLLMAEVGIALNVSRQIDFEQPSPVRRNRRR